MQAISGSGYYCSTEPLATLKASKRLRGHSMDSETQPYGAYNLYIHYI